MGKENWFCSQNPISSEHEYNWSKAHSYKNVWWFWDDRKTECRHPLGKRGASVCTRRHTYQGYESENWPTIQQAHAWVWTSKWNTYAPLTGSDDIITKLKCFEKKLMIKCGWVDLWIQAKFKMLKKPNIEDQVVKNHQKHDPQKPDSIAKKLSKIIYSLRMHNILCSRRRYTDRLCE